MSARPLFAKTGDSAKYADGKQKGNIRMTRIGPERAKELRDGAQPGPWSYNRPIVETDGGRGLLTAADPEYGVIGAGDGPLVAAAPELAEIVAGMTYEYTVYVYRDGRLIMQCGFEDDEVAGWTDSWTVAAYLRESLIEDGRDARLVRRLVSAPEVVE